MSCNTCKSTLLTLFFRNSCFTKRLVVYHPLTNLSFGAVGFLLIIETLIIILPTKRSVLRLPAYHADLKSIELIWATMKGYIARRNVSFKMTDVIQLTHVAIAAVTEDDWASSCRHVEEVERKYWDADIAVEAEMEKIVIQVTSSDEDTDTATECSDYSDTE